MSCENVQEQISLMLDRNWHRRSGSSLGAHPDPAGSAAPTSNRCARCGRASGMARARLPADLPRDYVSWLHTNARRTARASLSARFAYWAADGRLFFDNLMRPFAVPVTGGLFTALVLFSFLLPTLNPSAGESSMNRHWRS